MNTKEQLRTPEATPIRMDRGEALRALAATTDALCEMLRRYAAIGDRPIPHLTWTVSQCVAHMVISDWMYADQVAGGSIVMRIEQTSEINDWSVAPGAGIGFGELASDLERSTERFIDVASELPDDATFTWWSGSQASIETAIGLLVGERLVHGWDVAQALDAPWQIRSEHAALTMEASIAVMPLLVDTEAAAGMNALMEMRLRGYGRYALAFTDGVLTTSRVSSVDRADCRISAEPVAMLLVGYGRISQWGPLLRGRVSAWGRKPWLALRLPRVLRSA